MIKNNLEIAQYLNRLNNEGDYGESLLKHNITLFGAEIIDKIFTDRIEYTDPYSKKMKESLQLDVMRPNRFKILFSFKGDNDYQFANIENLIKNVSIPSIQVPMCEFSVFGKNVKIPLNNQSNMADLLNIKFYNDVLAKNIQTSINLLNKEYDIKGGNNINLIFYYGLDYFFPKDEDYQDKSSVSNQLLKEGIKFGKDLLKNKLDSVTGIPLSNLLGGLKTIDYVTADKKRFDNMKVLSSDNNENNSLIIEFKNIFVSEYNSMEFDSERANTYQDSGLKIGFNGVDIKKRY